MDLRGPAGGPGLQDVVDSKYTKSVHKNINETLEWQ